MNSPTQNGHANESANEHAGGEATGHPDSYFPGAAGQTRQRKAVIVGAGPVGCLAAIALANKGWSVEVYEGRAGAAWFSSTVALSSAHLPFLFFSLPDKRLRKSEEGQRSINLVLSSRGLVALHAIDPFLEERVMKHTIPIHSRMVHMKDGSSNCMQYDPHNQASSGFLPNIKYRERKQKITKKLTYVHRSFDCFEQAINSISRSLLNEKLMEEALLVPNIRFFFEHKPQTIDFHTKIMKVCDVLEDTTKMVEFDLCVGADGSHSFVRRQMMRITRCVCVS